VLPVDHRAEPRTRMCIHVFLAPSCTSASGHSRRRTLHAGLVLGAVCADFLLLPLLLALVRRREPREVCGLCDLTR